MKSLDREKARNHFKELKLGYEYISELDIRRLANMVETVLIEYVGSGDSHAIQMDMKVSKLRKKDIYMTANGIRSARIQINGSYFKRREGITFSETGRIGFGGEFSDVNVQPILKAFCKWCYTVST